MDIPMIGNTASRALCSVFHSSLEEFENAVYRDYDFTQLQEFGEILHSNIHAWFREEENIYIWEELKTMMNIEKKTVQDAPANQDNPFKGCTIVVTGKVEPYTRDGMNDLITSLGAHAGSKLAEARELGVKVLTPAEFFRMAGAA